MVSASLRQPTCPSAATTSAPVNARHSRPEGLRKGACSQLFLPYLGHGRTFPGRVRIVPRRADVYGDLRQQQGPHLRRRATAPRCPAIRAESTATSGPPSRPAAEGPKIGAAPKIGATSKIGVAPPPPPDAPTNAAPSPPQSPAQPASTTTPVAVSATPAPTTTPAPPGPSPGSPASTSGLSDGSAPRPSPASKPGVVTATTPKLSTSLPPASPFGRQPAAQGPYRPKLYPGKLPPDFGERQGGGPALKPRSTAPANIFREGSRITLQKELPVEPEFKITTGQVLLGLSFLFSIVLMIGTFWVVYKAGGVHFNE